MIIAPPGAGKTTVLTARALNCIEAGTDAGKVLCVTYTNSAAAEMKDRLVGTAGENMVICTLHSLGYRIIHEYYKEAGFDSPPIPAPDWIRQEFAENAMHLAGVPYKNGDEAIRAIMEAKKNRVPACPEMSKACTEYDLAMKSECMIDYEDMILMPLMLFSQRSDILKTCCSKYEYIFVDEFQDTLPMQWKLLEMLAGNKNICLAGDDDQCIFSFAGADPGAMRKAMKAHGYSATLLTENHRSACQIVDTAKAAIAGCPGRIGKKIIPDNKRKGEAWISKHNSRSEEAEYVTGEILRLLNKGYLPEDIAILSRKTKTVVETMRALKAKDIAYCNWNEDRYRDNSKKRLINALLAVMGSQKGAYLAGIPPLLAMQAQREAQKSNSIAEGLENLLKKMGWLDADAQEFVKNIKAFEQESIKNNESCSMAIEKLIANTRTGKDTDQMEGVQIMTIHKAKGMGFRAVFLIGTEEQEYMLQYKGKDAQQNEPSAQLAEAQRLFYVGITRASEFLNISYATQNGAHKCLRFLGGSPAKKRRRR